MTLSPCIDVIERLHVSRTAKATYAVGMFDALESLRKALIDLVSLGYQQKHLILLHPTVLAPDGSNEAEAANRVGRLVTPVSIRPSATELRVEFNSLPEVQGETHDVELVLDVQSWLTSRHFDNLVEALRNDQSVLFVRMHEQRQIAPTCSILLSYCTQHVNTHEVALSPRYLS